MNKAFGIQPHERGHHAQKGLVKFTGSLSFADSFTSTNATAANFYFAKGLRCRIYVRHSLRLILFRYSKTVNPHWIGSLMILKPNIRERLMTNDLDGTKFYESIKLYDHKTR